MPCSSTVPNQIKLFAALGLIVFLHSSWGFFGHRRINRMAVFTLPPEMISFYKKNIEFITAHSVDPDKRRYASEVEAPRHYIDIDHYSKDGQNPFELMPRRWLDAVEKYSEDTLIAYGIVPWHIASMTIWLTSSFEKGNANDVLRLSAEIGHYIGDAHVPLHTTENYNGQLTGQRGIHGLWESRIPELRADDYDYLVGQAKYIDRPLDAAWNAVEESHSFVDSVLFLEKLVSQQTPTDQKYAFEQRGASTVKQYSQGFALAYDRSMKKMVELRMRKAITMVGSIWYTAWINAGQPNLELLGEKVDLETIAEENKKTEEAFSKGKIKGREHDH
ncbi:MAG: S1/P1 Nuclease [Verrucomicrobia bacterium]|nr:S1/P1 Nuclease [Verrucomicrobiota bacterium]